MVVWKVLIHQIAPFTDKLPLELAEGERNFVAFDLLDAAYDHHDFDGFIHYEICNIVAFVIRFCHFSLFYRVENIIKPAEAAGCGLSVLVDYRCTKKETAHDEREPPLAIQLA